jgi:NTE family protein
VLEIELNLDRQIGLWETGAMPYLFEAGRRAAHLQLPRIAAHARDSALHSHGFGPPASR